MPVLLSGGLVWSGLVVCQGMCRGDVLSNYKPQADGQVTIHQAVSALQSAAGHDDQLMIPVSSTLSSAPSPHSPMASGAMEQIV